MKRVRALGAKVYVFYGDRRNNNATQQRLFNLLGNSLYKLVAKSSSKVVGATGVVHRCRKSSRGSLCAGKPL